VELACIKKHLDQQSISLVPMPQVSYLDITKKKIQCYLQFLAENNLVWLADVFMIKRKLRMSRPCLWPKLESQPIDYLSGAFLFSISIKCRSALSKGVKLEDLGAFVSFVDYIFLFLQIGGYELDLPQFSRVVKQFGGLQKVCMPLVSSTFPG